MNKTRTPFKQIIAEARDENADRLFTKARMASYVAKSAVGRGRRNAYRHKACLLGRLIDMGVVDLSSDNRYMPSLMLVHRRGLGSLHTHELWIRSSRKALAFGGRVRSASASPGRAPAMDAPSRRPDVVAELDRHPRATAA